MEYRQPPAASDFHPDHDAPISPVIASESSENVFDDEFAASEYAPSILTQSEHLEQDDDDPFRDRSDSPLPDSQENPFDDSQNAQNNHGPYETSLRPRDSIRKSLVDSQLSTSSLGNTPTTTSQIPQIPRHSFSSVTTSSFAPSQSPTASEHVPSHPYAMYPQVGAGRRTSLASSLAQRSSASQSIRNNGPTHPYGLYPQEVSPNDIAIPEPIHVGFPGHLQRFRRIIGPEGEEQDILGMDGHAEQLPPYTRFPEQSVSRPAVEPMPVIGEASRSGESLPEMQERSPFADPSDPDHIETSVTAPSSQSRDASPAQTQSEKSWSEKTWSEKSFKEKGKTKIFGVVKLWIILLAFSVAAFIIIFCGVFVSVYDRKGAVVDPLATNNVTASDHIPATVTYIDAIPTSTPVGLAPLPTGTFIVPLGPPDNMYNTCVQPPQLETWTCTLPGPQTICVSINQTFDGRAFLSTCNNNSPPMYGTQSPFLIQQTMKLVTDLDNVTLGPAWHFQTFYDKIVVLPQSFLAQPAGTKRDLEKSTFAKVKRQDLPIPANGTISVGDEAWFCMWDDTFIEGFMYAGVSNPGPAAPSTYSYEFYGTSAAYSAPTADSTLSLSSAYATSASAMTKRNAQDIGDFVPVYDGIYGLHPPHKWQNKWQNKWQSTDPMDEDNDVDNPTSAVEIDHTTMPTTFTASASSTQSMPSSGTLTIPPSTTASPTTSATRSTIPRPSCIPKLVRLEERRLKGLHDVAVCNLLVKMPDQSFNPVLDSNNVAIQVQLVEDDGPTVVDKMLKRMPMVGGGAALERRQSGNYVPTAISQTCYCQWTSEQFD